MNQLSDDWIKSFFALCEAVGAQIRGHDPTEQELLDLASNVVRDAAADLDPDMLVQRLQEMRSKADQPAA